MSVYMDRVSRVGEGGAFRLGSVAQAQPDPRGGWATRSVVLDGWADTDRHSCKTLTAVCCRRRKRVWRVGENRKCPEA